MHFFSLPLDNAPILVQAGIGKHGQRGVATVERWRLPELWCLHFYSYHALLKAELEADEREFSIVPGGVSLAPPDTPVTYHFDGVVEHYYAHFRLESLALNESARGKFWFAPAELAPDFVSQMKRLLPPADSLRAQIALWELLWQLSEASPAEPIAGAAHPALQRAFALIEARLEGTIVVAELAQEVGLSHNHLTRLCVAHTGQTLIGYVRARRSERAEHLLRHSTLPIKTIAAQVGVPSLGQFNHLMRAQTGQSPRAIRAGD